MITNHNAGGLVHKEIKTTMEYILVRLLKMGMFDYVFWLLLIPY